MKTEARRQAIDLYVRQNQTIKEIATTLGVSEKTVYKWRADDAKKGDRYAWERQREIWHLSPREMLSLYTESVKELIVQLYQDPERLADSRTADAITKHVANLHKIDPTNLYLGVAIDLMRQIDAYLAEHDPPLQSRIAAHWDAIKNHLIRYINERRRG